MKKYIIVFGIIVVIIAINLALAQANNEGSITYEIKINVHRNLPPDRQEMKQHIPEYRTHKDELVFNARESLYKPIEEDEEQDFTQENGMVRMRFMRPQSEIYQNSDQFLRITLQDFMGKKYRIEDTVKIMPWRLGSETKTILGYECKQASYFEEGRKQNIIAWYTDRIKPFLGPEIFNTLPGTVLAVDINEGERTITATEVNFRALKKNELKIPAGGTKITREEFQKMAEEQMQRMRSTGGNVMIRN
jgi:GLPGLI family protein